MAIGQTIWREASGMESGTSRPEKAPIDLGIINALRRERLWHRVLTSSNTFNIDDMRRYTVRKAMTSLDVEILEQMRTRKYGAHLSKLEPEDLTPDTELFICFAPDDEPVGSVRFSFDLDGRPTLCLNRVTAIPDPWRYTVTGARTKLSEAMRLCNVGRSKKEQLLTKLALWTHVYWRSQDLEVDWSLAAARSPLNADYRNMGYRTPGEPLWILPPDKPEPHEVLALCILDPKAPWSLKTHWMYRLFFERPNKTLHSFVGNEISSAKPVFKSDIQERNWLLAMERKLAG